MRLARRRPGGFAAAAGLLVLDAAARLLAGEPYPGATALLVGACGLSLLSFLPNALATPSLRLAALPALGLGSFALLLTAVSVAGIELTELSIRIAVAGLVVVLGVAGAASGRRAEYAIRSRAGRREGVAIAVLAAAFALAFASSYDVVDPFPPPGTDWAYYLLYADVVAAEGDLSVDNPYAVGEGRAMGHYPGLGAVYGSVLVLDGISSRSLAQGISVVSALCALSVYVAVAGLWGVVAGLLAAAAYAVAPIRLELMYWHGLGTAAALVYVPLVLLALGLLYRGRKERRTVGLLGFGLACVVVMHAASALVLAVLVGLVLAAEVVRLALGLRSEPLARAVGSWWNGGIAKPVLAGVAVACVLGAGVIVHLRRQAADVGSPVSYRFYDRDWFGLDTLEYYFSWPFLALVGASVVLVLWSRHRRRDAAVAAVAGLVLAAVLVSQVWRLHVPFEYRRVVYYAGPALVALVGLVSFRSARRGVWVAVCALAFVVVARESFGLRLPERLLRGDEARSAQVDSLASFREQIDRDPSSREAVVVADRCLGVRVQYFVRRPTLVSAEEWQAGFENLLPSVRLANAVVAGGPAGRRLAAEHRVRYVLVDPRCIPDAASKLGGRAVFANDELVAVELPRG